MGRSAGDVFCLSKDFRFLSNAALGGSDGRRGDLGEAGTDDTGGVVGDDRFAERPGDTDDDRTLAGDVKAEMEAVADDRTLIGDDTTVTAREAGGCRERHRLAAGVREGKSSVLCVVGVEGGLWEADVGKEGEVAREMEDEDVGDADVFVRDEGPGGDNSAASFLKCHVMADGRAVR